MVSMSVIVDKTAWELLTIPYYKTINLNDSVNELNNRGWPKIAVLLVHYILFPVVAFSRTDDDYLLMEEAPNLADCIWSLGTFNLIIGVLILIIGLIFTSYSWIVFAVSLIISWSILKLVSVKLTKPR